MLYMSFTEDDMPKTLFRFEFEDKDGKVYKQYVKEVCIIISLHIWSV